MFKITRNLGTIKSMASSQNQTSTNTNPAGIGQINLSNREIEKGFRAFFFGSKSCDGQQIHEGLLQGGGIRN